MDPQEILANADNISLEPAALENNQSELCKIWPIAKQALEVLKTLLKDPLTKLIIEGLIATGDAVTRKICN